MTETKQETLTFEQHSKAVNEATKLAIMQTLDKAMQLCGSGMTPSMIRYRLHNLRVEISGEGQRA